MITEGRSITPTQKSPMPAFARDRGGPLTAAQVKALADGIKKHWGPPATPAGSVPQYLAPAGTEAVKMDEGARAFDRACAGCHGMAGEGVERDGKLRRKINDPAFLSLISDQELRRYAITGRPDLGMPPYDGRESRPPDFKPLTSEDISNVVALLAYWRQGGRASDERQARVADR